MQKFFSRCKQIPAKVRSKVFIAMFFPATFIGRAKVCFAIAALLPALSSGAGLAQTPSSGDVQSIQSVSPSAQTSGAITEEELKRMLIGKPLFLRGGFLDDTLSYNEHGALIGNSPHASYTLCAVQIDKISLTKHKIKLEGARYGLHFLGALPYEDPTKAINRVKITPKKKVLRITIDRELVVKPKKVKGVKGNKNSPAQQQSTTPAESGGTNELQAEIAAAPSADRPADSGNVTTTTSPAHAARLLREALDKIFAPGLDERMIAAMPDFWKLYYQAAAAKTDYRPSDPTVMRQDAVDRKAKLLTTFEPASNQYAQDNGVAGMALYHVVVSADGKPGEIALARPIGFGLDENAVTAIQSAKFTPALKNGKPVPVLVDLIVQFRIYSKRTAVTGSEQSAESPATPVLPGPYSAHQP
jgi:TonB family protein